MKLVIEDDEGRRTIVPFLGEAVSIGRGDGNHVRLAEKNVSRKHGRIVRREGRFIVEDLKSFTGIRVNGEKVRSKRQIRAGDLIQISEYDIFLQYGPDDGPEEGDDDESTSVVTDPGSRRAAEPPPPPGSFGEDDEEPTVTPTRPQGALGEAAADPPAGPQPPPPPAGALSAAPAAAAPASAPALSETARPAASASAGSASGASLPAAQKPAGKPKLIWFAVAAVALLGAILLLRGRDDGEETRGPAHAASPRESALQKAGRAAAAHRYRDALKLLRDAQAAGAGGEELKELPRTEAEARAEEQHEGLQQAIHASDWEAARSLVASLAGSQTWWGAKAQEQAAQVKSGAVAAALSRGGALRATDPAGCLAQANLALAVDPQSEDARTLAAACGGPPAPVAAAAAAPAAPAAATPPPVTDAEAEARRLLQQGNVKVASRDFSGGVADLERALALKPAGPLLGNLYRSLAQAFQRQGDQERSVGYYKLYLPYCDNPTEKAFLRQAVDEFEAGQRPR